MAFRAHMYPFPLGKDQKGGEPSEEKPTRQSQTLSTLTRRVTQICTVAVGSRV